ncbi:LOW QUALITY PROTEIN: hypothetical protein U9M48_033741 [Paspalum notatum var. saurae]|uniref:Uncharacterized protein n=1 Tax=Paspalum notatum var. saurae TaxID=547442 RepID=A0AAQ3X7C1_PASNO
MHRADTARTSHIHRASITTMTGGGLLRHLHRCSSAVLERAMSLVCRISKEYAQHQVTERVARSRRALRCSAGQVWRRAVAARLDSLLLHVAYFVAISCVGWGLLAALEVRAPGSRPRAVDMFFTAVSAATVSSMSTVEMEVFSNGQLLVLTALMFIGGEVFVSLVGLASKWSKLRRQTINRSQRVESHADDVELETTLPPAAAADAADDSRSVSIATTEPAADAKLLRRNAVRSLFYIVLAILVVVHAVGALAVLAYISWAPGARQTLRRKALSAWTFAVFTTVSTFSSCGYMPTNENMAVFVRDVPLQLLLVPQALVGNTLFPPLLAACVWAAAAATRREELVEMARKGREATGYYHLLPARRCWMLAGTVAWFVAVQVALVCAMEWGGALQGLSAGEKVSNALFLAVNSRHTGESTLDLSTLAPAILVLFVLMMYLPPYTTWFPFEENPTTKDHSRTSQGMRLLKSTVLSQLSYLTIFVIAICITERTKLKEDPLNFNVLSIVVEVVSAYGNVGFSMGYSCSRQINPDQLCTDRWTGFAGRWSNSGKLILIFVMFFGRLKKFSMKGGKAWKLKGNLLLVILAVAQKHLQILNSSHKPPTMHHSVQFQFPSHIAMKPLLPNSEFVRIIKEKVKNLHVFLSMRLGSISKCSNYFFKHSYIVLQRNPFSPHLIYFMSISFAGFLALKNLRPQHKSTLRSLDLIFTSVSTLTVSSMATVEMEDFSGQQVWILILLMLLRGEVFTLMLGQYLKNAKASTNDIFQKRLSLTCKDIEFIDFVDRSCRNNMEDINPEAPTPHNQVPESKSMNQNCCNILAHVMAGYFVTGIVCSSLVIIIFIWTSSDVKHLLKSKNIKTWTFSIFTAVSSFVNCGFTPINDNMAIFRKNSGLLLLVIPQILAGNTLFTPLLRLSIWTFGKISRKKESAHIFHCLEETGYMHMEQYKNVVNQVLTTMGIILLQVMFLCYFGWDSKPLEELNWFQKLVCTLFQSVNTRHAGETIIDISNLSPPILVIFALFMYLPSDGPSLPTSAGDQTLAEKGERLNKEALWKNFIISKPTCLATFINLACITERKSMSLDPLNFNIFSIVFEIISAYGNVGYSLGYSCDRLLKPDSTCKAVSYGFVGRWTDEGKLIIILVMFLGRLKRFSLRGGRRNHKCPCKPSHPSNGGN